MAFPTTGVLSSFTGADEDPLSEGGNWGGPIELLSGGLPNKAKRTSNKAMAGVTEGQSYWTPTTFGPDQELFFTYSFITLTSKGPQLWGRISNPGAAGASAYMFINDPAIGFRYVKLTGGNSYAVLGSADTSHTMAAGEKMGFEITTVGGNAKLQGYWCSTGGTWTAIASYTDSSSPLLSAGYIGFNTQTDGNLQLDDFGGGTISTVTLDNCLPDADIVATGWSTAPLFSKVNDSSDATIISSTAV